MPTGRAKPRRVVVEADGGSRGNPGPAAYGALVRDAETGAVLAETAEAIGEATNNVAEYRGLLAGLALVREHAADAVVEVRMDSRLVVEQMRGTWKIKHPGLRPLALRARALAPPSTSYTWVPRTANTDADRLLNDVLDIPGRSPAGATGEPPAEAEGADVHPAVAVAPSVERPLTGADDLLGEPTTLLLVRHGETTLTAQRRFSGSGGDEPGLTDAGRAQAAAAADLLLARGGVDALLSSPLRRARETAEAIGARLDCAVGIDDDLRECDFGEWDGHSLDEVREGWPEELAAWLASTSHRPPGGESLDDVERRVRLARDRLLAEHAGRTVVAVSHVTPVKLLVRSALDAPMHAVYRMELSPGSLSELWWYPDGTPSLRVFGLRPA